MKKSIVLLLVALFLMPLGGTLYAASKKKKEKGKTEEAAPAKKESKYDKLLKKPGVKTVRGILSRCTVSGIRCISNIR